ncbi:PREDICTED: uncharacterized protein LOC105562182 isoform X2 [Vollenhovia emeryi]|nr:PREDICTED: uncharacterized protein LOC105562182 isoform X2 [Vollenhovia emeryi]XP_011868196.1 PREDICTED: uncharacterized protein LOC105562182 isoform X2 [Vollenhovia emeryi]XP_011868197.1 PREDICTED: uncharacterized protein LOC105562182 isoform X2 [Vollenhovia emeryi]XP_011868198.1 PREDICTED: uncharacterized protein LOC105562182 isoform X2 [Vollenhovia emeryi]
MEGETDNLYNARLQKVRRRLFHDEDDNDGNAQQEREDVDNRFKEEMRIQQEQKMKKWNFDFVHGRPLPGRYEWVRLDEHGNEISESNETNGRINSHENGTEEAKDSRQIDGSNDQSGKRNIL